MRPALFAAIALLSLLPAGSARADHGYVPVPAGAAARGALELKVVTYAGAVNGELTVEVHNPGRGEATFDARGLYFVPGVDADAAPQRLGAVGPMQVAGPGGAWQRKELLHVPAGATIQAKLDVYCIDSHRASPGPGTGFSLARERMPKALSQTIQIAGDRAARGAGGFAAPPAKAAIQSEVWKSRDDRWVPLEGEGKQEVGK